jgi:putative restriction endonuclease
MDGFIAVTDPGWYEQLARTPGPKDANFWRPSARPLKRLPVGAPFLFKLKGRDHAIAGFGFFASFTILPDWLAWDTFGEANGVESLEGLRRRLQKIRDGARIEADPAGRIGCCLIAETRFFPPELWVEPPKDWKPRTQTGATYDLSRGEGARVWRDCLQRGAVDPNALVFREVPPPTEERYGAPTTYQPRLGQGIFRVQVLDAYDRACAVTREHSLPVLEAAHIRPYATGGEHRVSNGLTLRTDLHRLFDRGYVTVDEDHQLVVGRRLKDDFDNGRSYYSLHGRPLEVPAAPSLAPDRAALAWHREHVFLG